MTGPWKIFWPFAKLLMKAPTSSTRRPDVDAELTRKAANLLRGAGCRIIAVRVTVAWHPRLSSTAGLARPADVLVLLNPRLKEYAEEVDRTLRHELAHLIAFVRAKGRRIKAHGPEWKKACVDLGIPGESRCHALPLPRRLITRRHVYRCPRCHFILRRVRPIRARRRLACLDCCKLHARGRYDSRFEFVKLKLSVNEVTAKGHPAYPDRSCASMIQLALKL